MNMDRLTAIHTNPSNSYLRDDSTDEKYFGGPMTVAIASGLLIVTIHTLLVLPIMYVICYKKIKV